MNHDHLLAIHNASPVAKRRVTSNSTQWVMKVRILLWRIHVHQVAEWADAPLKDSFTCTPVINTDLFVSRTARRLTDDGLVVLMN